MFCVLQFRVTCYGKLQPKWINRSVRGRLICFLCRFCVLTRSSLSCLSVIWQFSFQHNLPHHIFRFHRYFPYTLLCFSLNHNQTLQISNVPMVPPTTTQKNKYIKYFLLYIINHHQIYYQNSNTFGLEPLFQILMSRLLLCKMESVWRKRRQVSKNAPWTHTTMNRFHLKFHSNKYKYARMYCTILTK